MFGRPPSPSGRRAPPARASDRQNQLLGRGHPPGPPRAEPRRRPVGKPVPHWRVADRPRQRLAPVLPGITDGAAAIDQLAEAAAAHGAGWLWRAPLRLRRVVQGS